MKWLCLAALALALSACTVALDRGERLYRQGDRLGALEVWRAQREKGEDEALGARIREVEAEFDGLVVRYVKRGQYYEARERLAESMLNYRLALKLRPDDAETLGHVQELARELARRRAAGLEKFRTALDAGDLARARRRMVALRELDPLDPDLETEDRRLDDALDAEIARQMELGRRGFAAGNYTVASKAFRTTLELDPENSSARGYLAYIATIRRENDGNATPTAFPADGLASDSAIRAEGFYQSALAAEREGELFVAIRHDLRALRADGSHRAARRHLDGLRKALTPQVEKLIESGRQAFGDEDLQLALDHWRQALLVDPGNERVTAYVARAEQQLENLERLRADPVAPVGAP